jgi:rare lipoprotein A
MTKSRRARLGIGALMIGIPASAAAITAGQALAAEISAPSAHDAAAGNSIQVDLSSRQIDYGHDVVMTGAAPASDAGHTVALEYARAGTTGWQQLSSTTVDGAGYFRLAGPLEQSGLVRALDVSSGSSTQFVASAASDGGGAAAQPVQVKAKVRASTARVSVLEGQPLQVRGRLLPGLAGRKVSLQGLESGRWHTLATARTKRRGAFVLHYVASSTGRQRLRVRFAGDLLNAAATSHAGQLTVFQEAEASWYEDGGETACGFHAFYGVANRTLPCGTKVEFRYNGRSVNATVDDRGPYVGGRDWDLNQNTAQALGFGGVGEVWSSQ